MHLYKLYRHFDMRCKSYSNRANEILSSRGSISIWQFNYMTEVLISDVWQAWNFFCRELFMSSYRGCVARNGQLIAGLAGDHSWKRIAYVAKQAKSNKSPTSNGHNAFPIRNEPTWGDLSVFIDIVNKIRPDNYNNLLASYGSFSSLKQLQYIRNACAHKNVETMDEIRQLSSVYRGGKIKSATDLAWRINISESVHGIELWIFEMNLIADLATSQR